MNLIPFAQACASSYMPGVRVFTQDPAQLTHVFLSEIDDKPCFTYEGTTDTEEWLWRDFLVLGLTTFEHPDFGPLHDGIAKGAFGTIGAIMAQLEAMGWPPYYLAGHSKGAGETIVAAAELKRHGHPPSFYTAFEGPHVGTQKLRDYLADVPGAETATANSHGRDLVTIVPWATPILNWMSSKDRIFLPVPDSYDIRTKHRIPAVIEALGRLPV